MNCSLGIRHVRIEKGTAAKTRPAMVPGIVTKDALVSYWPIFFLSPVTDPEVIARVNSAQFPSEWFVPVPIVVSALPDSAIRHKQQLQQYCQRTLL